MHNKVDIFVLKFPDGRIDPAFWHYNRKGVWNRTDGKTIDGKKELQRVGYKVVRAVVVEKIRPSK